MARKAPKINNPRENPVEKPVETKPVIETKSIETKPVKSVSPFYQYIEKCCAELGLSITECDQAEPHWPTSFDEEKLFDEIRLILQRLIVDTIVRSADATMVIPINCHGVPPTSIFEKVSKAKANLASQGNAYLGMTASAFSSLSRDKLFKYPRVTGFDIGILGSFAFPIRPSLPYECEIKSLAVYYSPDAIKVLVAYPSDTPIYMSLEVINKMGCGYIECEV